MVETGQQRVTFRTESYSVLGEVIGLAPATPATACDDRGTRRRAPMRPDAEPFAADGAPVGAVLCHGLTGMPGSMRPWAEQLAAAGRKGPLPRPPGARPPG